MEAKDGSFGFDFEATYEEIIPFERLVYRIADGREVVASFTAQENNCTQLRVTFEAENYHTADGQHDGGQSIFNNLKKYTTTNLSE